MTIADVFLKLFEWFRQRRADESAAAAKEREFEIREYLSQLKPPLIVTTEMLFKALTEAAPRLTKHINVEQLKDELYQMRDRRIVRFHAPDSWSLFTEGGHGRWH